MLAPGHLGPHRQSINAIPASTEQASPPPAVEFDALKKRVNALRSLLGRVWMWRDKKLPTGIVADIDTELNGTTPAQPAPGGAERCPSETTDLGSRARCILQTGHDDRHDDGCIRWSDPTPAEPGDRPVMLSELLELVRDIVSGDSK